MTDRLVTFCDDLGAVLLHTDGWRVQWFANVGTYHGAFAPHFAFLPIEPDAGAAPPRQVAE